MIERCECSAVQYAIHFHGGKGRNGGVLLDIRPSWRDGR